MRKFLLFLLLLVSLRAPAQDVVPKNKMTIGVTGVVNRHAQFASKYVDARNVDVWLPPGYEKNRRKRYPVLYMHDGQNVFDPGSSYIGVDWGVDETMTRLVSAGRVKEAIVVAVWNTPKRVIEYMPQKAVEEKGETVLRAFETEHAGRPISDSYLKFLVLELKPFVDSKYRTLSDRKNTFIMGSSMGGLISVYAVSTYPEVFGGAGCISTHWPAGDGLVIDYLSRHMPDLASHKLYFDYGTETLDALYEPFQRRMDGILKAAGYRQGTNWLTERFPGAEHSERAWSKRVDIPLIFLLGK
jgi:predicted alpha/beta superfamily hydrolase